MTDLEEPVNVLLDVLAESLRGWSVDTDSLLADLTVDELTDVKELAKRIYQNGSGGRTLEKVESDSLNGKLGEYALYRRFKKLGIPVTQNFETITKEKYWDLKINIPELGREMVLEVKRQARRSVSANFTRPASAETMCQFWRDLDAVVIWVPEGRLIKPWFVLDASGLDPNRKLMQPLSSRPGFCLPVQSFVENDLALVIEP